MPRRRYDGPTEQDVTTFRRVVLSHLHSKGIEGGYEDASSKDIEFYPYATVIRYTYPLNWTDKQIKRLERGIDNRLRKAFG